MARRSPLRLALDVAMIAALAGAVAYAVVPHGPVITLCESAEGAPRYDELPRVITVAAVFGVIEDVDASGREPGAWSYHAFEAALEQRGLVRVGADRFAAPDVIVDVIPPLPRDPAAVTRALDAAIALHDVVYYDGHDFDGDMQLARPRTGYRLVVLDSCWSTQHYSPQLVGAHADVVGNTERAVTGSFESFLAFLDGVRTRASWRDLLAPMNELAARRLPTRPARKDLNRAEHYRHDVACR